MAREFKPWGGGGGGLSCLADLNKPKWFIIQWKLETWETSSPWPLPRILVSVPGFPMVTITGSLAQSPSRELVDYQFPSWNLQRFEVYCGVTWGAPSHHSGISPPHENHLGLWWQPHFCGQIPEIDCTFSLLLPVLTILPSMLSFVPPCVANSLWVVGIVTV